MGEAVGFCEIAMPHPHSAFGQRLRRLRVAHAHADALASYPLQQLLHNGAAKLPIAPVTMIMSRLVLSMRRMSVIIDKSLRVLLIGGKQGR